MPETKEIDGGRITCTDGTSTHERAINNGSKRVEDYGDRSEGERSVTRWYCPDCGKVIHKD